MDSLIKNELHGGSVTNKPTSDEPPAITDDEEVSALMCIAQSSGWFGCCFI